MTFIDYLRLFHSSPLRVTLPSVAFAVYQGRRGGYGIEERSGLLRQCGVSQEIISEAETWLAGCSDVLKVTSKQRSYVRRMIACCNNSIYDPLLILQELSPLKIPDKVVHQRKMLLELLHGDWRGMDSERDYENRSTTLNQLAGDGRTLLNCRHTAVVFPEMSLEWQARFFVGAVTSGTIPIKAILLETNERFKTKWLLGIVRLAECPDRIPGSQMPSMVVRDEFKLDDCRMYLNQVRQLYAWICSDQDSAYRCSSDVLDPYTGILLPRLAERDGWASRLVFAVSPQTYPEAIF